jgi:exonuclease SbcC
MSNTIELKSIQLTSFKGIKNLTVNFNHVTNIYGANAAGKSSVFDAFTWLLFGKNAEGKTDFGIKTYDQNGIVIPKIDHQVEAIILVDNEEVSIKRVLSEKWQKKRGALDAEFTGNETLYFWNDVPKSQREFQDKISSVLDEGVFKLITNPLAFNNLKWQDRRQGLIAIVGDISDKDIASGKKEFEDLLNKLSNKTIEEYRKELASKRKILNDSIKSIPTRIDEVSRNTPEAIDFAELNKSKTDVLKQLEAVETQIENKNKAQDEIIKKYTALSNQVFQDRSKIQNIEFETKQQINSSLNKESSQLNDLKYKLETETRHLSALVSGSETYNSKLVALQAEITSIDGKIQGKRDLWVKENAKQLTFSDEHFNCPTCKKPLEQENIEQEKERMLVDFKDDKAIALKSINNEGVALANQKFTIESEIKSLSESLSAGEILKEDIKKEIETFKLTIKNLSENSKTIVSFNPEDALKQALESNKEYQAIKVSITKNEEALQNQESVNIDALKEQKTQLNEQLRTFDSRLSVQSQIEQSKTRVSELETEEKNLAQQISNLEKEQYVIESFIKVKIDKLESTINKKFKHVNFKLFDIQVNGQEVECCEALVNGVPFSDANTASKLNAGLDIINTLCEFYNTTAPIFIDNRESVVDIIECNSQIINLIVSKQDKTLRII